MEYHVDGWRGKNLPVLWILTHSRKQLAGSHSSEDSRAVPPSTAKAKASDSCLEPAATFFTDQGSPRVTLIIGDLCWGTSPRMHWLILAGGKGSPPFIGLTQPLLEISSGCPLFSVFPTPLKKRKPCKTKTEQPQPRAPN
ncbi:Hypothetical predicted protein [Marmota monax]|uniref:Uncharacterized protein n=1 Tax=Marmota monax TaxID=9995 RepID=A0A5E4AE18_MARMO|nr:Hypothetical predicted protein [Marmota monax]